MAALKEGGIPSCQLLHVLTRLWHALKRKEKQKAHQTPEQKAEVSNRRQDVRITNIRVCSENELSRTCLKTDHPCSTRQPLKASLKIIALVRFVTVHTVCLSLNSPKAVNTRGKKTTPWAVYMLFVLETTSFSILQMIWEEINLMV